MTTVCDRADTLKRVAFGVGLGAALLAGCVHLHDDTSTGDAHDRELLKSGMAHYLAAKYAPNVFGVRRTHLERAQMLFQEVLDDDAASLKSKREAADMLVKVNERLRGP